VTMMTAPTPTHNRCPRLPDSGRTTTQEAQLCLLVRAFQQGDDTALAPLMTRFGRPMRCVAHRYLSRREDIDDALQDAWTAFARSAHRIRSPLAVGGWLCVTTARAALAIARHQARCDRLEAALDDAASNPDANGLESEHASRAVKEAVARLAHRDRELISMLFDAELSYEQICEQIGRAHV